MHLCYSISLFVFPSAKTIAAGTKGDQKIFLITCLGHCRDISVSLEVESGDADLYAREDVPPEIDNSNCDNCPLCKSRQSNREDSCTDISTEEGDSFYLMVTAHKNYRVATIKVSGYNLKSVRDIKKMEEGGGGGDLEPTSEEPQLEIDN